MTRHLAGDIARKITFARRRRGARRRVTRLLAASAAAALAGGLLIVAPAVPAQAACANPIACENQLPGTPQSVWDVGPGQGTTIQGFADPFSVNIGGSINFKIS